MNEETFKIAENLISANYVRQAQQSVQKTQRLFKTLLSQRALPDKGWSDQTIEIFLQQLSEMDSNNYVGNVGLGEREGRVYSNLVAKRHFYFSHGIGRSGDISENQPKAAGSSLLLTLTNHLATHALKIAGAEYTKRSLVVPMATGMSIALVLLSMSQPMKTKPRYVIWLRIDQKSVLKSIQTAGFEPVVIENVENYKVISADNLNEKKEETDNKDALTTDLEALEQKIVQLGVENILCVVSTTSCFAPRLPDKVVSIAKMCKKYDVGHIINNAYGVQCNKTMKQISSAMSQGRVDAFVQSTDKNFMVPVGGAIISSANSNFIDMIASTYAGRASMSPILDLFITLLSMGVKGWKLLLSQRKELVPYLVEKADSIAIKYGEQMLKTVGNTISFAMTLDTFGDNSSKIGSQLFYRCVSGPRVVKKNSTKEIAGIKFAGYGSHTNNYPHNYMTMACAIGITREEIDQFLEVLDKTLGKARKESEKKIGNNIENTI
jgi:O-phospho-L-seryl-tRNASec:L-selenocysteinyl-tRNA synthase